VADRNLQNPLWRHEEAWQLRQTSCCWPVASPKPRDEVRNKMALKTLVWGIRSYPKCTARTVAGPPRSEYLHSNKSKHA
jgi:hypothetical protein